jgi:hypothetical protein
MSSRQNSRVLAQKSWAVLKGNHYLLAFPIAGMVLALVPLAVFGIPALLFLADDRNWLAAGFGVLALFGVQAVATVMAAGLAAAADEELHGRDASFGIGVGRAMSRLGPLIQWSVIVTVVSVILGLLRGNNSGSAVGNILRSVAAATAGVMWSLITFLVIPIIMFEKVGAMTAIKESALLFKQHWGTQIIGGVRVVLRIALFFALPGIVAIIAGVLLLGNDFVVPGVVLIAVAVILFIITGLLSGTVRGVFQVALYRFARDGVALGDFTVEELQSAVRTKAPSAS